MESNETDGFENCLYTLDQCSNDVMESEKNKNIPPKSLVLQVENAALYSEKLEETLLQKSERFKREYPEKYAQKQHERLIRKEESLGIFRPNEIIDAISDELGNISLERERELARRRNMPPLLHLRLQYFEDRKKKRQDDCGSLSSMFGESEENITKFDHKNQQGSKKDKRSRLKTELRIVAVGASNLHKWIHTAGEKFKAKVVCAVQPDSELYGTEMATRYAKANQNKITRWGHIFILRGFAVDVLMEKMITFTIEAQTSHGKKKIGHINISTQGCILGRVNESDKDLCNIDARFWKEFLLNPTECIDVHLPLFPSETVRSKGSALSVIQRLTTIRRKSARRPKFNMKTFRSTGDLRFDEDENPTKKNILK